MLAVGQGAGNRLLRTIGALTGIAGVGNLAGLGSIAWLKEELNPLRLGVGDRSIRLDLTTGTPGTSGNMDGAQTANSHKGKIWNSVRPDQLAYCRGGRPIAVLEGRVRPLLGRPGAACPAHALRRASRQGWLPSGADPWLR